MERPKRAALAGAGACLVTVLAVVVPYLLPTLPGALAEYYGAGAVGPLAVALLALVGAVAFASGAYERTDPDLVSGLLLVAGAASFLIALEWALALGSTTVNITTPASPVSLSLHPWVVLLGTLAWTVAAAWYAASLGLLGVTGPE